MDESLIPPGRFCFRVVKIRAGEIMDADVDKYGRQLREFRYLGDWKVMLCPYWTKTEYKTVRCAFLNKEFYTDAISRQKEKILAHFGSTEIPDHIEFSHYIHDEIKVCGIKDSVDDETEWLDDWPLNSDI